MFNGISFNRSPFNRKMVELDISAIGAFVLAATAHASVIRQGGAAGAFTLAGDGVAVRVRQSSAYGGMEMGAAVNPVRRQFSSAAGDMVLEAANVAAYTAGSQEMTFTLSLSPGDELVIDTDKMTVTLNGVNMIEALSDDSVFVLLYPGENMLDFGSNTLGAESDIYVLWKDVYL